MYNNLRSISFPAVTVFARFYHPVIYSLLKDWEKAGVITGNEEISFSHIKLNPSVNRN